MGSVYPGPIRVRVHDRGDRRLDGILRLIEEAGRPRPLPEALATLCREIAEIARAEVVSIYVREDDALVMRGNVGFPAGAVGQVRLRRGEGLTGIVAECLRPVSVAVGPDDERYKHVPGLGEEHYPAYLGVPLLVGGGVAGVLVLQRREARVFPPAEVALATALAAPVAYALERGRARTAEASSLRAGLGVGGARSARLGGVAVAPGVGLGRADLLPGLGDLQGGRAVAQPGDAVALAFSSFAREVERARRKIERTLDTELVRPLRGLSLVLEDCRLRDLAIDECARRGVADGMRLVAREYARAAYRVGAAPDQSAWHTERATEIEDLCVLVGLRAIGVRAPTAGSVLVAERLTGFLALALAARRAEGLVLAGRAAEHSPLAAAIVRAIGVPTITEVAGLFAWIRPGDRVLVDADSSLVRVNPSETSIARFRARSSP